MYSAAVDHSPSFDPVDPPEQSAELAQSTDFDTLVVAEFPADEGSNFISRLRGALSYLAPIVTILSA